MASDKAIYIQLYTNTVLDGSVILSVIMSVCSFAIETIFPLFNFKTKHIFEILMALRKSEGASAAEGTLKFYFIFLPPPKAELTGGEENVADSGYFASYR